MSVLACIAEEIKLKPFTNPNKSVKFFLHVLEKRTSVFFIPVSKSIFLTSVMYFYHEWCALLRAPIFPIGFCILLFFRLCEAGTWSWTNFYNEMTNSKSIASCKYPHFLNKTVIAIGVNTVCPVVVAKRLILIRESVRIAPLIVHWKAIS